MFTLRDHSQTVALNKVCECGLVEVRSWFSFIFNHIITAERPPGSTPGARALFRLRAPRNEWVFKETQTRWSHQTALRKWWRATTRGRRRLLQVGFHAQRTKSGVTAQWEQMEDRGQRSQLPKWFSTFEELSYRSRFFFTSELKKKQKIKWWSSTFKGMK